MPEHESHRERVKKLLAQDQEINDPQLKEFRMQLEQSLESWEAKAKKVRRGILIAVAVFAAANVLWILFVILGTFVIQGSTPALRQLNNNTPPNYPLTIVFGVIAMTVLASSFGSFLVGIYLVALYFFKYAPALKRVRFDVQTTMMLELTQQVEQLRQDIERRKNS